MKEDNKDLKIGDRFYVVPGSWNSELSIVPMGSLFKDKATLFICEIIGEKLVSINFEDRV